jgi:Periplasmic binding protein
LPWTIGWQPNFQSEARIYAEYLLNNHPQGKVGVLYQNDHLREDYLKGLKDGLNNKVQIVADMPYEVTDPTVDSQIVSLKAPGADSFFNAATPELAAQAIKKGQSQLESGPICLAVSPPESCHSSGHRRSKVKKLRLSFHGRIIDSLAFRCTKARSRCGKSACPVR